jgi:hypothetical protein
MPPNAIRLQIKQTRQQTTIVVRFCDFSIRKFILSP